MIINGGNRYSDDHPSRAFYDFDRGDLGIDQAGEDFVISKAAVRADGTGLNAFLFIFNAFLGQVDVYLTEGEGVCFAVGIRK